MELRCTSLSEKWMQSSWTQSDFHHLMINSENPSQILAAGLVQRYPKMYCREKELPSWKWCHKFGTLGSWSSLDESPKKGKRVSWKKTILQCSLKINQMKNTNTSWHSISRDVWSMSWSKQPGYTSAMTTLKFRWKVTWAACKQIYLSHGPSAVLIFPKLFQPQAYQGSIYFSSSHAHILGGIFHPNWWLLFLTAQFPRITNSCNTRQTLQGNNPRIPLFFSPVLTKRNTPRLRAPSGVIEWRLMDIWDK